jgi:hypothetical protein
MHEESTSRARDDQALRTDATVKAEQSVLGGLLNAGDQHARSQCNGLSVQHFQSEQHRAIFQTLDDDLEEHGKSDWITVSDRLSKNGRADLLPYVSELAANTPGNLNIARYAALVEDNARLRSADAALDAAKQAIARGDGAGVSAAVERAKVALTAPAAMAATPYVFKDAHTIPPRDWLYRHHLIRKFVAATVGPPAGGKTSVMLLDYISMVVGRDLPSGRPLPTGPLRVWVINMEDPREEIERRIAAICLHYGVTAADIGGRLFVDTAREHDLVIVATVNGRAVTMPRVIDGLIEAIRLRGVDVLSVDPLIHSHAVAENDNTAMALVMKSWAEVAERAACAVEIAHHIRKNGGQETSAEDMRGAAAMLGAVRSARLITTMSVEESKRFDIPEHARRFYLWANPSGKPSMAPPVSRRDWYYMEGVNLNNGTASQPSDVVGVATRWAPPDAFDGVTMDDARRVLAAIAAADPLTQARASSQSAGWVGHLVARELDLDIDAAGVRDKLKQLLSTWQANGMLAERPIREPRARRDVPVIAAKCAPDVCADEVADDPL